MSDQPRYAIYFVPAADSTLYRFGAALLGYDTLEQADVAQPQALIDAVPDWHALTGDPRRYGFHATLKAPFSLAPGASEAALIAAFEQFAASPRAIPVVVPVVKLLRQFVAIVNDAPNPDLTALADACVTEFESFRAPLTAKDRERRLASRLTGNQIALLDRWGYPYVFEEFFFHMSLTGRIAGEPQQIADLLALRFAGLDQRSLAIDRLALLKQDHPAARFAVIRHLPLKA
jgi:putative phosphonate metabolism protein